MDALFQSRRDGVKLTEKGLGLAAVGGPGDDIAVFDEIQGILDGPQTLPIQILTAAALKGPGEIALMPLVHELKPPLTARWGR